MVAEHHRVGLNWQSRKIGLGDGRTVDALDDGLTNLFVREARRLGVEGEVAPLQRTGSTHVGVITLLGRLIAILGDDGVGDVNLLVGESLRLGSVLHRLEGDGVKLRLVAPPLVITLDGQGLGGLVDLGGGEWASEPVRVRGLPAGIEGIGVRDPFLRQHTAPCRCPVGISRLVLDDDVGVLGTLLNRRHLVKAVGGGGKELVVLTVGGFPGGLVVRIIDSATRIPLRLRVEVQRDNLLAILGVHLDRLDVVRIRLRSAILGNIEVVDTDELPDSWLQVN